MEEIEEKIIMKIILIIAFFFEKKIAQQSYTSDLRSQHEIIKCPLIQPSFYSVL